MTRRCTVFLAIALLMALTVTTSGCGGGGSSSESSYWGGGDGGASTAVVTSQITAVNNMDLPGQPIRVGDWIEIQGTGFGDTRLGTTSDGSVVFSDGVTDMKAINYGKWTDALIECQVPQGAPVKALTARENFRILVLRRNMPYGSSSFSANGNPTPNPSPQATPPSPSPSPSPSVYPTPSPTPTPSPSATPAPTPSQTSGGGGGGGGGGGTPVATKLSFTVQPADATLGETMAPAVKVAIQDGSGSTMTSATDNVTVALDPNGTGAALSGTLTKPAVNGVATFDDLKLDKTGSGYTLTATSGTLTAATSSAFNVNNVFSFTSVTSYSSGPGPSKPPKEGNGNDNFIPNGDAGTKVIITGTGLGGAQGTGKVTFKGATGAEIEASIAPGGWMDTGIECTVPLVGSLITDLNTGTGEVKVTTSTSKTSSKPFVVCPDGMTYIPAGQQNGGAISELYMGECEVTKREIEDPAFNNVTTGYIKDFNIDAYSNDASYSGSERPANAASWYLAVLYCNFLSQQKGITPYYAITSGLRNAPGVSLNTGGSMGYRLGNSSGGDITGGNQNKSEWEYACRANTTTAYYWGDSDALRDLYSWNYWNQSGAPSGDGPQIVGQKIPNLWGLYDMSGNVWEWTNENNGSGARAYRGGGLERWTDYYKSSCVMTDGTPTARSMGIRIVRTK